MLTYCRGAMRTARGSTRPSRHAPGSAGSVGVGAVAPPAPGAPTPPAPAATPGVRPGAAEVPANAEGSEKPGVGSPTSPPEQPISARPTAATTQRRVAGPNSAAAHVRDRS